MLGNSVTPEDLELTKYWIRNFILAQKLGVKPDVPREVISRLNSLWAHDDYLHAEYRMLWQQIEEELSNAP